MKDAFDEASVLHQLNFFHGGSNENLSLKAQVYNFLSPNNVNRKFISFLLSDTGQNIVTNNSLSIHVESGNTFYQNFNTNENFYSFLLAQQDETKTIIPKRIFYHHILEKYTQKYLPFFSIDYVQEFDLFSNKNSKNLFYKFNVSYQCFMGRETNYSTYCKSKRINWHGKN